MVMIKYNIAGLDRLIYECFPFLKSDIDEARWKLLKGVDIPDNTIFCEKYNSSDIFLNCFTENKEHIVFNLHAPLVEVLCDGDLYIRKGITGVMLGELRGYNSSDLSYRLTYPMNELKATISDFKSFISDNLNKILRRYTVLYRSNDLEVILSRDKDYHIICGKRKVSDNEYDLLFLYYICDQSYGDVDIDLRKGIRVHDVEDDLILYFLGKTAFSICIDKKSYTIKS